MELERKSNSKLWFPKLLMRKLISLDPFGPKVPNWHIMTLLLGGVFYLFFCLFVFGSFGKCLNKYILS